MGRGCLKGSVYCAQLACTVWGSTHSFFGLTAGVSLVTFVKASLRRFVATQRLTSTLLFFFSRHHGVRRCKDSLIFISLSCSTRTVAIFFLNDFCSGIPQVEGFFWRTGKYCLWWCSFLAFFARTTKLQTYRDLAQWLCLGLVDPCRPRKIRKRTPWRFCQDEDPGTSQPLMFGPWHCCC